MWFLPTQYNHALLYIDYGSSTSYQEEKARALGSYNPQPLKISLSLKTTGLDINNEAFMTDPFRFVNFGRFVCFHEVLIRKAMLQCLNRMSSNVVDGNIMR